MKNELREAPLSQRIVDPDAELTDN